jgi:hypothetical protein
VDKIKTLHEQLLKASTNYTKPHYDYDPPLSETALDFASTVQMQMNHLTSGSSSSTTKKEEVPKSLSHYFAKIANAQAESFGTEEPMGNAFP